MAEESFREVARVFYVARLSERARGKEGDRCHGGMEPLCNASETRRDEDMREEREDFLAHVGTDRMELGGTG